VAREVLAQTSNEALRDGARAVISAPIPVTTAPTLFTVNGCGATLYGARDHWSDGSYVTTYYLTAVFIPVMSSFNMAYQSLGAEMTPDYNERTNLYSFRFAFQKIPEFMIYGAPWFTTLVVWVGATHSNLFERVAGLLTSTATTACC